MCLRGDIDRGCFDILENEEPFATTLRFSSNTEIISEIKFVTSLPPAFTIKYVALSSGQIIGAAKDGAVLKYDRCLEELKLKYGL